MFCPTCGSQIPDGATFCPSCGNAAAPDAAMQSGAQTPSAPQPYAQPAQSQQPYAQQQQAQPVQQPYAQQPHNQQPYAQQPQYGQAAMGETAAYRTMGGWLLFFVILTIVGIAFKLIAIIPMMANGTADLIGAFYGSEAATAIKAEYAINIILALAQVYFLVLIFQRNTNFLKVYQILQIAFIAFSIIDLIMVNAIFGEWLAYVDASALTSATSNIIAGALGLILMTMYYCKSVRVRTYMGGTEYQSKALFRIGA